MGSGLTFSWERVRSKCLDGSVVKSGNLAAMTEQAEAGQASFSVWFL